MAMAMAMAMAMVAVMVAVMETATKKKKMKGKEEVALRTAHAMPSLLHVLALLLATAPATGASPASDAATLAPNLSSCHLATGLPAGQAPFNCCAPLPPYQPRLFRPPPPTPSRRLRVRHPAHLASPKAAHTLARAYSLMKALPDHDPRSFTQQANIHCAYCNAVYDQLNSSKPFQVHASWLFFPFHRWYLYFHERILAKLLSDDNAHGPEGVAAEEEEAFSLPFWNYDIPEGASMPWMYTQIPPLNQANRDTAHLPPAVVPIDYLTYNSPDQRPLPTQIRENQAYLYRALIRNSDSKYTFHGQPYRHGDDPMPGYGSCEKYPHNTVHLWIGSKPDSALGGLDMGYFYASARDPLFYPHHAAIDRLWEVWLRLPGNSHLDDLEYLDAEFAFYNEEAEMVRVKVRDALETTNLGYVYQEVETPWVDAVPVRLSHGVAQIGSEHQVCEMGKQILRPCSVVLQRKATTTAMDSETEEESLHIGGVRFTANKSFILAVFLNLPCATEETTTGCREFLGSAFSVPQFAPNVSVEDFDMPLTRRVVDLGLGSEPSLVFTFVPRGLHTGCVVSITTLSLEYSKQ